MTKHRTYAIHEPHDDSDVKVLHHPAKSEGKPVTESSHDASAAFLEWPSHFFEMMMMPWRALTPMELWIENKRFGSKPVSPKTETKENEAEYLYMVELPGIIKDQIALNFQHGFIMLRVEATDDQRVPHLHSHHARSIRRAFSLPVFTDADAITAEFKDSLLTITIPKTSKPVAPKARTIDIT